jgi:hypothetical protein
MWAQLTSLAIGLWLMAAPAILDYGGIGRTNHRIVGPIVIAIAAIATAEVVRGLRWVNVLSALWLAAAPSLLGYVGAAATNSITAGVLLLLVAPQGRHVSGRYGGGWRSVFRPGAP